MSTELLRNESFLSILGFFRESKEEKQKKHVVAWLYSMVCSQHNSHNRVRMKRAIMHSLAV